MHLQHRAGPARVEEDRHCREPDHWTRPGRKADECARSGREARCEEDQCEDGAEEVGEALAVAVHEAGPAKPTKPVAGLVEKVSTWTVSPVVGASIIWSPPR